MSPDTKWETEHTAEWDNAFALMAELHPYLYQTAGKVQYPMKNAGSLDLLATKQIDMTPAFVNMVLSQKNMGTMPESIKLQPIEPAFPVRWPASASRKSPRIRRPRSPSSTTT